MSYEAKVFSVMIASPSDVASERHIIREAIHEWNDIHSQARKIVLLPVGWESHSSPEMGSRPQEIINNQLLDKCDLLVGVLWTRIGTSTGEYSSGTVEEIEKIISAGKPVMLYFSQQPVVLDSVDLDQYGKLKEFKLSCQSRGLYETYDSHSEFKEKFYHQLQLKLNEHPMFLSYNINAQLTPVLQSGTRIPQLSTEARILLKEASLDKNGTILLVRTAGGAHLQTNGKSLITEQNPREVARWESALKVLLKEDLVQSRGYKGEVFEVSNLGYQIADMIEL